MTIPIREGCGTYLGLLLHKAQAEPPCSECAHQETIQRLEHEAIPHRLPPAHRFAPITPQEAEHNRQILFEATKPVRRAS